MSHVGRRKSFARGRSWKRRVRRKQVRGVMSGRTAKEVSPTRPRVALAMASVLRLRPRRGATARVRIGLV